jgi:hypothetical protein
MTIEQWWNLLDPDTQRWLVENPGCAVLPRTVVNAVNRVSPGSELLAADAHGECSLSLWDREFIRKQARAHAPQGWTSG